MDQKKQYSLPECFKKMKVATLEQTRKKKEKLGGGKEEAAIIMQETGEPQKESTLRGPECFSRLILADLENVS